MAARPTNARTAKRLRRGAIRWSGTPLGPPKPVSLQQLPKYPFCNEGERQCDSKNGNSVNARQPADNPGGKDDDDSPAENSEGSCFGFASHSRVAERKNSAAASH